MVEIKGYRILRSIGVGATSEVFEAERLHDGLPVALKVFTQLIMHDADLVTRLESETDALRRLEHPNVVRLNSPFRSSTHFALDLELVEGQDLRHWLSSYDVPLIEPLVWLLVQIARGLGAAHEMGVIHRDLKPENVLVSDTGEVKITDFGLAREINRLTITRMGLLIGSLGYIAPEIINGHKASERSDIFSFGVLAYETLSKHQPFAAETPQAMIRKITEGSYAPLSQFVPQIPDVVAKLIEQCLKVNPEERPQSIWELEAKFMTYLGETGCRSFCRKIVSRLDRDRVLAEVLQSKHQQLWILVEKAKKQNDRGRLVSLATEILALFPDDAKAPELLVSIRETEKSESKKKSKRTWAVLGLVVFMFGLLASWWRSEVAKETAFDGPVAGVLAAIPIHPDIPSTSTQFVNSNVNPAPKADVKPAAVSIAPVPKVKNGSLKFLVPSGVDVAVDDVWLNQSQIERFSTTPGYHYVKMQMKGYLPIESRVLVQPGKLSVIRAEGATGSGAEGAPSSGAEGAQSSSGNSPSAPPSSDTSTTGATP